MTETEFLVLRERVALAEPIVKQIHHLRNHAKDLQENPPNFWSIVSNEGMSPDDWDVATPLAGELHEAAVELLYRQLKILEDQLSAL